VSVEVLAALAGGTAVTDVTSSVVSVSVSRGREDETEPFQTGRASLTVRNIDGTFDPVGSPFRLRDSVTVSWSGNGTAVPVFTGFVEDVTLGYDLSGDATVQVSCVDGLALLANQTIVAGSVSEEDSGARVTAVLGNSGVAWPAGTAIDAGISILAAGTADGNALQYLRQVEQSEQGYLYVDRQGTLTFRNRHTTLNNPIAGTQFSDDGTGIPYVQVERFSGARSLFNKVTGELEDGTAREANDLMSQGEFSIRTLDLGEVLLAEPLVLEDFVEYLLAQFSEPATRVDRLTVNLERLSASDAEDIVSFEVTDICDVEFTPPGRSPFTDPLLVQGVRHDVTVGGAWRTTLSFQRRDTRSFLILDDLVQGKMDDSNVLAF
jgi:hypothetical protein